MLEQKELQRLFYIGFKHYIGKTCNMRYERLKRQIFKYRKYRNNCDICGHPVIKNQRSIDHIVPLAVIYELELAHLLFEISNLQFTHKTCNGTKSNVIPSELNPVLLQRVQYAIDFRNSAIIYS